ncbi:MAG: NAD-dependent epimerase/dehydratase family protein [Opitutales bacterium]|jgi:UDP-glucose 4-epimerase
MAVLTIRMTASSCKVLVTGATGFLGRILCSRLQETNAEVVAVGRSTQEGPWSSFRELDLAADPVPENLLAGVGTIYHLASKAHAVTESESAAGTYRPVIVTGTQKLLEAASQAGVERFIYVSSVKAMGEGNPKGLPLVPMDESWPNIPQGPYGLAKSEAEACVRKSNIQHSVILRPVMVYGPGEKGNLPRMVQAVRRRRFPPLPNCGNRRSMIHVDDLVEFMIRATGCPTAAGKTYILAGTDALSTRELYDAIRRSLGMKEIDWSIPMPLLGFAAGLGSLAGALVGRRWPLDRETLGKLTGSAWYSSALAIKDLDYEPVHTVRGWLESTGLQIGC